MKLTHPIHLKSYEAIVAYTTEYMKKYSQSHIYVTSINLPEELYKNLSKELCQMDLPRPYRLLAVKRRNCLDTSHTANEVHIDDDQVSIVLPIENYEDTVMYWYDGNYDSLPPPQEFDKYALGANYKIPSWKNELATATPQCYTEQITSPTVCRVDIPHSATSRQDGSYRLVLTFRLEGNPSFDDVCEKIK